MRTLARRALAECVGTALLVTAVIGSGIAAARLSPGDVGLQLPENSLATGVAPGRPDPRAAIRSLGGLAFILVRALYPDAAAVAHRMTASIEEHA